MMASINKPLATTKLIAITGPTGAGKTTFINSVCGSQLRVGTSLQSCTDRVQIANCVIAGHAVTLIDTPGFDDTHKSQAEILRDIGNFLETTYEKGAKLAGVIYMHRISDFRMGGIARENFRLFRKICGDDAMKNVLIVTTMWEDVTPETGASREQELATKSIFFKDAVDHGARMIRHYDTAESAKDVIELLLPNQPEVLLMQHEIVYEHKRIPTTTAGIELRSEFKRQEEKHEQKMIKLRREMDDIRTRKEASYEQEIQELKTQCTDLQEQVRRIQDEMKKLAAGDKQEPSHRGRKFLEIVSLNLSKARRSRQREIVYVAEPRHGWDCIKATGLDN
ncbi:hypothetical protein AcW1_008041 [Taiwanofungus camphoratus]|nr:hypothetical protein AcW1_008041 [Antrodia cinnamomea]